MKTNAFCTIITPDYLPYAMALYDSLKKNGKVDFEMYVFIACKSNEFAASENSQPAIKYLFTDELCKEGIGKNIFDKYHAEYIDEFRWSMKPVLINYLIQINSCQKVIYADSDLFFYSDYEFLFDALDHSSVLLTPHWRSSDPHLDAPNFQMLFDSGIYNAGFVAANKDGIKIMDWWASACLYLCVKDSSKGHFVDQTYLNLFHILSGDVNVVRHKGCNVANWNQIECKRIRKEDGSVWINSTYPIVFIHFTASTIKGILMGEDSLLRPHLEEYAAVLKKYNSAFDLIAKYNAVIDNSKKSKSKSGIDVIDKFKKWIYARK